MRNIIPLNISWTAVFIFYQCLRLKANVIYRIMAPNTKEFDHPSSHSSQRSKNESNICEECGGSVRINVLQLVRTLKYEGYTDEFYR